MKIIDLLRQACDLLDMNEEREVLDNILPDDVSIAMDNTEISRLYNLSKFSIQELCTNYIPMVVDCKVTIAEEKYPISNLNNCIHIQDIYKEGKSVNYKQINRNIVLSEMGEYIIEYLSYPDIKSLYDDIDFLDRFNPDILVFGLCAYYTLSKGMFDDFKQFYEKYIERAENLKELKIFSLPERRWE